MGPPAQAPVLSTRPPKTALSVPTAAETGPSGDVDFGHCGLWFTSIDAYSRHRCDGACITPTDCGLVVAPRVKLTWSIPVRVPTAVDPFGNVTEWVECDREIAGQWDQRQWRDHPF